MTVYKFFTLVHVAFGTVALATFWITAALRKGTRVHRRTGGAYLLAMTGVLLTTPMLAGAAFLAGNTVAGAFLAYLTLITATAVWLAWRAIRDRAALARYFGPVHRGLAIANLAAGVAMAALGAAERAVILIGMALIGIVAGTQMLRLARRPPTDRHWWLERHWSAILGCGIATHIAFLNIGLQRLLPADSAALASYVGWFGPIVGAIVASAWLRRKYAGGLRTANA